MTGNQVEYEYDLVCQGAVLEQFYLDQSPHPMVMGPLGSAKTTTSCQKVFDYMCAQSPNPEGIRPSRWVAVRNTAGDLSGTTIKDWLEMYGDLGRFVKGGSTPACHFLKFELDDGTVVEAEMIFLPLDREDAVRKLRGYQVTGLWLNEVKELNKAVVDIADSRHGRYPTLIQGGVECDWHGMIGDYNAPDEDEWIYKLAEEIRPDNWSWHKQPGAVTWSETSKRWIINEQAENKQNLPDLYYENLIKGKAHDWIKVNVGNEYGFAIDGKPVHPAYQDSIHSAPCEAEPGWDIQFGLDFGLTPAAAIGQKIHGQWRIFREVVTEDMAADEFAPMLRDVLQEYIAQGFKIVPGWGDPSGGSGNQSTKRTPFMILNAAGVPCNPTAPDNNVEIRRKSLSKHFLRSTMTHDPGIIIDPRCMVLRKGLAGKFNYRRIKVAGDERYHDQPDKNKWSHVCESLEYLMVGAGEGRELVSTPGQRARKPRVKRSLH